MTSKSPERNSFKKQSKLVLRLTDNCDPKHGCFLFFPTVIVPFSFLDSIVTIFLSYCLPEVSLLSMSRSQSPNPSSLSGTHLPPLQFLSRNPQLPSPPKECRPPTLSASQCGQNTKAVTDCKAFQNSGKPFGLLLLQVALHFIDSRQYGL